MIRIRLQRTGRKNRPFYRIVACEHTSPIKGRFIEKIGYYNPLTKECAYDQERYDHWTKNGAKPSETVSALIEKKGKIQQKTRKRVGKRQKARLEAEKAEAAAKKAADEEAKKAAKEAEEQAKATPEEEKAADEEPVKEEEKTGDASSEEKN